MTDIMQWILAVLIIVCLITIGVCLGYQVGYHNGRLDTLPTQSEVQETLGLEPDGIIGPESRRVWNEFIERRECDEAAVPVMEAFNKDFDRVCLNGMEF